MSECYRKPVPDQGEGLRKGGSLPISNRDQADRRRKT